MTEKSRESKKIIRGRGTPEKYIEKPARKKMAEEKKGIRKPTQKKIREYHLRYREMNHKKLLEKQRIRYREVNWEKNREYRARYREANRQFMIRYREKRPKTFAETLQEQLRKVQRHQRETQQKLKALGSKRLSGVLTDCLKSPTRYPVHSAEMRSPVLMYLESFCHSLSAEEYMSFDQMREGTDRVEP